jgi:hypothetical protein
MFSVILSITVYLFIFKGQSRLRGSTIISLKEVKKNALAADD